MQLEPDLRLRHLSQRIQRRIDNHRRTWLSPHHDPEQVSVAYQLGIPISQHKYLSNTPMPGCALFLILLILSFVLANMVIGGGYLSTLGIPRLEILPSHYIPVIICLLVGAVLIIAVTTRKQNAWLYLYDGGLVHIAPSRGVFNIVRWHEIEEVWIKTGGSEHDKSLNQYQLCCQDGRSLLCTNAYSHFSKLHQELERHFVKARLPQLIEEYRSGKAISFGRLSFDRQGISDVQGAGRLLPWYAVEAIRCSGYTVEIKRRNKWRNWLTLDEEKLPNACLLEAFVDYLRPIHRFGVV
jgi:hypothetical protein